MQFIYFVGSAKGDYLRVSFSSAYENNQEFLNKKKRMDCFHSQLKKACINNHSVFA